MAAYGALVSLSNLLNHILHPPPLNKIAIPTELIEFLQVKVDFFIDFLECYPSRRSHDIEDLLMQMSRAAYAAQDVIESNVLTQIHQAENSAPGSQELSLWDGSLWDGESTLKGLKDFLSMVTNADADKEEDLFTLLCEGIKAVTKEFVSIEEELIKIKVETDLQSTSLTTATSSEGHVAGGKAVMVGFKKYLFEVKDALTSEVSKLQVISIVGMGGIGKTTLATAVYNDPFIVEHFYVSAWVTVSQQYTVRELLICLLYHFKSPSPREDQCTDDVIGELLYKELFDRKYLIVMDDMWDVEAWDQVKRFFPDNENGSRVLVTTRQSNLTEHFTGTSCKIDFLDKVQSWDLLCKTIFGGEDCPVELVDIGKIIAERCVGLPLALVVIGGLLAKSERTSEHWDSVAGDISSALRYGDDEHVTKILSLSYIHLPLYLKPCFLYLAVFPEDHEIRVSTLVKLWVAEGLIKPSKTKCLEEVAHECFENLIDRNLILSFRWGSLGNVRSCKIHDVVRNLCIAEAAKEKFLYIANLDNPNLLPNIETERRLSLFSTRNKMKNGSVKVMKSAKFCRSILSNKYSYGLDQVIHGLWLLNIVSGYKIDISKPNNLRYVVTSTISCVSSMSRCWNLQTLVISHNLGMTLPVEICQIPLLRHLKMDNNTLPDGMTLPVEIWQMPQLRHLKLKNITLPDPPPNDQNVVVLKNLQTLKTIRSLKLTEEVLKRIPNLKKLGISYDFESSFPPVRVLNCNLSKLVCFEKLESLRIYGSEVFRWGVTFPVSLKKLTLRDCKFEWEDTSIVALLPNLEVLKLIDNATEGQVWNPIEGGFCRLKFLMICRCELKIWQAENDHFPRLEHLVLRGVNKLKRIPMSFAEILTLQVIELDRTIRASVERSARKISKQRTLLGYEPLKLHYLPMEVARVYPVIFTCKNTKSEAMNAASKVPGVEYITFDMKDGKPTVTGEIDVRLVKTLRKISLLDILSVSTTPRFLSRLIHNYLST